MAKQRHTFLGRDIHIIRRGEHREFVLTQDGYSAKLKEMDVPDGVDLSSSLDDANHNLYRANVGRLNWV